MNIERIKKAEQRIDVGYISTLGIKAYGRNNLYPQQVKAILDASSTGSQCADRYARFIEGGGMANMDLYGMTANHYGETVDDIVQAVAQDMAFYGGFALHVNYDLASRVCEVQHVPFESCRLQESDDSGYIGKVITHPDWAGGTTRGGRAVKVNKTTITTYDRFNPDHEVVMAQIVAAGGIERYNGQIMWVSTAGRDRYPAPKYDRVLTELSTDEGLGNIKFRNTRCNFLSSAFVVTRRGQTTGNDQEDRKREIAARGFAEQLAEFQGDEMGNVLISLTVENDEDKPEILEFPTKNFDKDFDVTDRSVVERIYCAFEQDPFLCIRNGKLGFSGTTIHDCYSYYASLVSKEQRIIERALHRIFEHWHQPLASTDCALLPLKYNEQ